MPSLLVPLVAIVAVLLVDYWVFTDATQHAKAGRPVVFRAGALAIDTPVTWAIGCLLLWIVFLPLYLTTRSQNH